MYLKCLELSNFKCYSGSQKFVFSPATNYFVGNNNAGKTTVLDAIAFLRDGLPNGTTIKDFKSLRPEGDQFFVEGTFSGEDLPSIIEQSIPKNASRLVKRIDDEGNLIMRRSFSDDTQVKKVDTYNPEDGTYSNVTGISAPIQAIFEPTFMKATDTPDNVISFKTNKTLGRLIAPYTESFMKSKQWDNFNTAYAAAFNDTEKGYVSFLDELKQEINTLTNTQYGKNLSLQFKFEPPEPKSLSEQGTISVYDGFVDSDLKSKGNGIQRAIAFAIIEIYAKHKKSESGTPLFLCLDEPETWMHPQAQVQLAEAISDISQTEQVWVSTHSPYMLRCFAGPSSEESKKTDKLYLFRDFDDSIPAQEHIVPNGELGTLRVGHPSLAEITYQAFQMPTPEFHSELYGLLQEKLQCDGPTAVDNKLIPDIKYEDDHAFWERRHQQWISKGREGNEPREPGRENYREYAPIADIFRDDPELKQHIIDTSTVRFDSRSLQNSRSINRGCNPIVKESLPTFIRNSFDHPESLIDRDKAKTLVTQEEEWKFFNQADELENTRKHWKQAELKDSTEILIKLVKALPNPSTE
ncbi:AAA family ATPase [Bifidobacterium sp. ESL0704]|uniref:AAA family ATPase n=1 Tax=Bifidobacterium sp. ESL0704 TaxID=2983219 RepID=UPI0023F88BA6|nr:AAA family ATPase [Bifidobacterium sp. ESL0704]WEV52814.1 AAA family ATPase [Bifidobacterium sp. ESL0704]